MSLKRRVWAIVEASMLFSFFTFLRRRWDALGAVFLIVAALVQVAFQLQEQAYVRELTLTVIKDAGAKTPEDQVLAVRDYLRNTIEFNGAPVENRPFLRETAAVTLRSGKGYCGEVSRTFICMAGSIDIRAQRINLYGKNPHVVAEVELPGGQNRIVDCQNPPRVVDLEPLEQVMIRGGYDDYSTLNVRRLGLDSVFSRVKMQMGLLTYWGENPYALRALFYSCLALGFLLIRPLRWSIRGILRRRGWVHESDKASLEGALDGHAKTAARERIN